MTDTLITAPVSTGIRHWKVVGACWLISIMIALGSGYYICYVRDRDLAQNAQVTPVGPAHSHDIIPRPWSVPVTEKCASQPITIKALQEKDRFKITASNTCKETYQEYELHCPEVFQRHQLSLLLLNNVYMGLGKIEYMPGLGLGYMRHWPVFGGIVQVGAGADVGYSKGIITGSKLIQFNVRLSASW